MLELKGRIAWALTLIVVACAVHSRSGSDDAGKPTQPAEPEKPRLTVNHTLHGENGLECADCHDPEKKGEPGAPPASFCFECHDDIEGSSDRIKEYFAAAKKGEDEYAWPGMEERDGDLIFSHASHTGSYEVTCAHCHGEPAATAFVKRTPLASMASCYDCHEQRGAAAIECSVCHVKTRADQKPDSHDASFQRAHGALAPAGWRTGESVSWREPDAKDCSICHSVPNDCSSCHQRTQPDTHREAGFREGHGQGYLDAGLVPFEDSSCSLCHTENACVRCHQTTKPRNHTLSWQRRFHGLTAEIDRSTCLVCHKQNFCVRCHETARPVSHRGTFASGPQSHCVACHEPLTSNGCYTCHKNTRGHLLAPRLPAGLPHSAATDCRTCHSALKHFDDGLSCRRCHR